MENTWQAVGIVLAEFLFASGVAWGMRLFSSHKLEGQTFAIVRLLLTHSDCLPFGKNSRLKKNYSGILQKCSQNELQGIRAFMELGVGKVVF